MPTDCSADRFEFARVEGRAVVAAFDGGTITSDAGALLLGRHRPGDRPGPAVRRLLRRSTARRIRSSTAWPTLVGQRVFALALGYEDLVDHDTLRHDPVLAAVTGKLSRPPRRLRAAGRQVDAQPARARAGRASRRATTRSATTRAAIERLFVELFLDAHATPPEEIVLDLDATDDPLHGAQEGRFFHGYYDCYCYLPLYVFCGDHLLAAKLRRSNIDASAGAVEEVARIVAQIRARWPQVRIVLRADSAASPARR